MFFVKLYFFFKCLPIVIIGLFLLLWLVCYIGDKISKAKTEATI